MDIAIKILTIMMAVGSLTVLGVSLVKLSKLKKETPIKENSNNKIDKDNGNNKIEEIEARLSYLEFCKRVPEGVELKVKKEYPRGFIYAVEVKNIALFEYNSKVKEICYLEDILTREEMLTRMEKIRDEIYKNTPDSLIIFNKEYGYIKIEKSSGNVMNVSDLIEPKKE